MTRLILLAGAAVLAVAGPSAAQIGDRRAAWNKPTSAFRVIGNVYYVGTDGLAAYLIVTPQGLILLDGALPESAPLILKNVRDLGLAPTDIKFLLNSHAHYDHSGGLAELKRVTGATMVASAGDKPALELGRVDYGPAASVQVPPVVVDRVIGDRGTVRLGGAVLTAHLTPGHTKGCTSWTMPVVEKGKSYAVYFHCSTTVAGNPLTGSGTYPTIVKDYEATFARLKTFKADVFLANHPEFARIAEKRARITPGGPNPFIDAGELPRFVAASERDFRQELQRQTAAAAGQGQ